MTPGTPYQVPEFQDFIEERVEAYESAQRRTEAAPDLADFLPQPDHPHYRALLRELIRVDLEYGWERGRPRRMHEYRQRFPALFDDPQALQEVAYEEYRLRLLPAGTRPRRSTGACTG